MSVHRIEQNHKHSSKWWKLFYNFSFIFSFFEISHRSAKWPHHVTEDLGTWTMFKAGTTPWPILLSFSYFLKKGTQKLLSDDIVSLQICVSYTITYVFQNWQKLKIWAVHLWTISQYRVSPAATLGISIVLISMDVCWNVHRWKNVWT